MRKISVEKLFPAIVSCNTVLIVIQIAYALMFNLHNLTVALADLLIS